jgi:peptidyl-prolyl cis-trans isomerase SurA
VAAEEILFLHDDSFQPTGTRRTRGVALELARRVLEEIRGEKLTFHQACERYSEAPASRKNGGYMGIFERDTLAGGFEDVERAIFGLETGQVSDPVASPLGVHLFRRIRIEEWAGSHILIQYAGAKKAPDALRRSREEAERAARRILAAALEPGADFAALARRYSEAPDSAVGGSMGIFGRYEILPQLQRGIAALRVGEVGGPIESPLGYHLVRRDRIERAHAAHILLRYKGCQDDIGVASTREEALAEARRILALVVEPGADFATLARKYSQEGSAARGGRIGFFTRGRLLPPFEKAVFALEIGGTSDIVETDHGFHIIRRLPEE